LPNRRVQFFLFQAGAFGSYSIHVATHFGDSAGGLTTSSMPSMKDKNSGTNRSDLDKNNIFKPTFDTLTDEDRKEFEAYHVDFQELFLSHCKVMRKGTILWDITPIVFNKHEVTLEVRPDSSSSHNDI
jgi:hypothetical protein